MSFFCPIFVLYLSAFCPLFVLSLSTFCTPFVLFAQTPFGLDGFHALNPQEIPVLNRPKISIHNTHLPAGGESQAGYGFSSYALPLKAIKISIGNGLEPAFFLDLRL